MENPIKEKIDELGISTHAAARIVELAQPVVYRHYAGTRRLSADSMEMYNGRLGIPMNKLREWNRYLKKTLDSLN